VVTAVGVLATLSVLYACDPRAAWGGSFLIFTIATALGLWLVRHER
jgi:hypothetical protein